MFLESNIEASLNKIEKKLPKSFTHNEKRLMAQELLNLAELFIDLYKVGGKQ